MTDSTDHSVADSFDLVLGCDDRFSIGLGVMLYSVLKHLQPGMPARVFILDDGISPENRERIERIAAPRVADGCVWLKPQLPEGDHLKGKGKISKATYSRILIPHLLPADVKRAVFVDVDMLCCRDLGTLATMPLDGNALLAVQDYRYPTLRHTLPKQEVLDRLERDGDAPYFNGGFLVFDMESWRQDDLPDQVFKALHDVRDDTFFVNQDGLNIALQGKWKQLAPSYNVQENTLRRPEKLPDHPYTQQLIRDTSRLLSEPGVYHYTGHSKPWTDAVTGKLRGRWASFLAESDYFSTGELYAFRAGWASRVAKRVLSHGPAAVGKKLRRAG
ncbi:MAG: glycosyltransferase family 8 protein [Planctomycetota bacterium]